MRTEIPLKEWRYTEARRSGVSPWTIYDWYRSGRYSHLKFRRVSSCVIMVSGHPQAPLERLVKPYPELAGLPKREWMKRYNALRRASR